jgi:hypothetical protein
MGISERESYQNKPRTTDALKANITKEIQAVTADVLARISTHNSIEEFKHMLSKEVWNEVYNCLDLNSSVEAFLGTFLHSFNTAFPYKMVNLRERPNKRWLSKGLID